MEIKAVRMFDGGFMSQPFAFGGEEGPEKFDPNIRYRGSLQNSRMYKSRSIDQEV